MNSLSHNCLTDLKEKIISKTLELGFEAAGITDAAPLREDGENLQAMVEAGYYGEMHWLAETAVKRSNPAAFFPQAKSVLIAAHGYFRKDEPLQYPPDCGQIALYARGRDYHKVLRNKLKKVLEFIKDLNPAAEGRIFVDSFPIMEKPLAVKAGLGWIGKNTCFIIKKKGSWYHLGGILLNLPLKPDEPLTEDFCGSCHRCMDACPTGALLSAGEMDARRCISYLTIEHHGEITTELVDKMGNLIFGCDICQIVCPWNRKSTDCAEPDLRGRFSTAELKLERLSQLTREEFEQRFAGTPLRRAGYESFTRNLRIAIKNLTNERKK
ncbi:MAG: tRNA epoxyqueuosine(34) reductase QueG [Calditrichia bacterium]